MSGTKRGQRKREQVSAMAWLLQTSLLPHVSNPTPVIIDAGCGTGSLLLPLAALFPSATFVGIDTKAGSLERLASRAAAANLSSRVVAWHGRIEDYDAECDCLLSLHACGGASDASLRLAAERSAPFAVSPCCIGKLRREPASERLREMIAAGADATAGEEAEASAARTKVFALLAAWADSEHVAVAPMAPSIARSSRESHAASEAAQAAHIAASKRRQQSKTLVELDRLWAMDEWQREQREHDADSRRGRESSEPAAGRLLRITGDAMATSGQVEVLTGPA